jgi:hypothetical protein
MCTQITRFISSSLDRNKDNYEENRCFYKSNSHILQESFNYSKKKYLKKKLLQWKYLQIITLSAAVSVRPTPPTWRDKRQKIKNKKTDMDRLKK